MDLPLNAMTPRMRRALVTAAHHAKSAGHRHIGTEHVLLALALDGEGIAGQVLTGLGARQAVQSRLSEMLAELGDGTGEAGHPDDAVRIDLDTDRMSNHPIRVLG